MDNESITVVKDYWINLKLPEKIDANAKARRYYEKWNQFEIINKTLESTFFGILTFGSDVCSSDLLD